MGLGGFWVDSRSILGRFWLDYGSILGRFRIDSFWIDSGSILDRFWVDSELILGNPWQSWSAVGVLQGRCWPPGRCWDHVLVLSSLPSSSTVFKCQHCRKRSTLPEKVSAGSVLKMRPDERCKGDPRAIERQSIDGRFGMILQHVL